MTNRPTSGSEMTGLLKVLRAGAGGSPQPYYQAFLLRLWRESPGGPWRASLENIASGEKHGFGHLEQLVAFLENGSQPASAAIGPEPSGAIGIG